MRCIGECRTRRRGSHLLAAADLLTQSAPNKPAPYFRLARGSNYRVGGARSAGRAELDEDSHAERGSVVRLRGHREPPVTTSAIFVRKLSIFLRFPARIWKETRTL
jgi:hypothetical protein